MHPLYNGEATSQHQTVRPASYLVFWSLVLNCFRIDTPIASSVCDSEKRITLSDKSSHSANERPVYLMYRQIPRRLTVLISDSWRESCPDTSSRSCPRTKSAELLRRTMRGLALSGFTDCSVRRYTGWPKKMAHFLYALTSNLFYCLNHESICNNTVTKDPTTPQACRYTTLWNTSVLKATTENKTTSVTTHFKKLTTGNNVFIVYKLLSEVGLTVASCSFYIKWSMCPPCCWTTHS